MKNKFIYVKKGLLLYMILVSATVCYYLLMQIGEILEKFNVFLLLLLLLNSFTVIYNSIFLLRKNSTKDWKATLLYNFIFGLFSGFSIRLAGIIISINLGTDFSLYFTKNQAGIDYGYHYDIYNVIIKLLFYDTAELSGFSIQINLVMVAISALFFTAYKRLDGFSNQ